jgi:hypothetical protein
MEKEILTNNVPATEEALHAYPPNPTPTPTQNRLPQMFLPLLILFGVILMSVLMKREDQTGTAAPPTSATPTTTVSPTRAQLPKPVYKTGEYLTFVHFAQGFSISYPAESVPELRGAGGGNFYVETGTTKNKASVLVYIQPVKQDVAKLTLQNVTDLSYDDWDRVEKIFSSMEEIMTKEQINLGGKRAFRIVSNLMERIIVPNGSDVLVIEIHNKKNDAKTIDKILSTFSLIPPIPASWKLHEDTKYKTFRIKHPANYNRILSEARTRSYDIVFEFPDGSINFSFPKNSTAGLYEDRLDFAVQMEQSLKEDVLGSKFNQNAFTFVQGGDVAIRVVHPSKQDLNLYFYLGATPVRVNAPIKLEAVLNQMLVSLNEEYSR